MTRGEYLVGLAFFAGTWGAVLIATAVVLRRRLDHLHGVTRGLAFGVIATALVIGVHVLPAALGILTRGTALATALVAVAVALALPRLRPALGIGAGARPDGPPDSRVSWAIAGLAGLAIAVYVLAFLGEHLDRATTSYDYMSFHLPGVARWIQTGSIWTDISFLPFVSSGTYPNSGDVVFLSAVLPWHDDVFARLVNLPYLGLTGLAAYALGRELRAPAATAALFAAALLSIRVVAVPAIELLKPETIMLAAFGAGVVFALRQLRTGRTSDLVLAGLGLGIAAGARWNGISAAVVAVVGFAVGAGLAGRAPRRVVRDAAGLAGLAGALMAVWLVRNAVNTGNPIFPFGVSGIFDAAPNPLRARYGGRVLDYVFDWHVVWHSLRPAYGLAFGAPGLLLVAGLVVGGGTAAWGLRSRRGRPDAARTLIVAVASAAVFAIYAGTAQSAAGTPGHPDGALVAEASRWAMPAMVLAAGVCAWLVGRAGRWRRPLEVLTLAAVVHAVFRQASSFRLEPSSFGLAALIVLAAATAVGAAEAVRRSTQAPAPGAGGARARRVRAMAVPALAAVAAIGLVAAGRGDQRRFDATRYRQVEPALDWVTAHAPAGHRVALVGTWASPVQPQLPLFGPRLRNRVRYVGRDVGGILFPFRRRAAFLGALRAGRYDVVVIGRGYTPSRPSPEPYWAWAAGLRPVAASPAFAVFEP